MKYKRRSTGRAALFSMALLLAATCRAGDAQLPAGNAVVHPARFTATAEQLHQMAYGPDVPSDRGGIVVVDSEDDIELTPQGEFLSTYYVLYRVLNSSAADSAGEVSRYWQPWSEERPVIRARVLARDGKLYPLDASAVVDSSVPSSDDKIYSDRMVVRAPLPAVSAGAVIELEVKRRAREPFAGAGFMYEVPFAHSYPVLHQRLVVRGPPGQTLRSHFNRLDPVEPTRDADGAWVTLTFERGPAPVREPVEDYLPGDVDPTPSVTISTGRSWQAIASAYDMLVRSRISVNAVRALSESLTKDQHSYAGKVEALANYVKREIRYTGIELSESEFVPHAPESVLEHRYGDCKDKATLLVALLRGAGIPAQLALVDAGDTLDVEPDSPAAGQFDHAIVHVPGTPELWIDPTSRFTRGAQLPLYDQGRRTLIVDQATTALQMTPESSGRDNVYAEDRQFFLSTFGPGRIIETSHPQGAVESRYRNDFADGDNKQTRDNLTRYMKSEYLAEALDDYTATDAGDLSIPYTFELASRKIGRGQTDLSEAVVAIRRTSLFQALPSEFHPASEGEEAKPAQRINDFLLPKAYAVDWSYRIVAPPDFVPKPLPTGARYEMGPASLVESFAVEDSGVVRAHLRFEVPVRRLTPAQVAALRAGVLKVLEMEPILVRFIPRSAAQMADGKPLEALDTLRRQIAREPELACHHLRKSSILLDLGLGATARDEDRLAVTAEPDLAVAHQHFAETLQRDELGRPDTPGSDYAQAQAQWRAAASLDPQDKGVRLNLAISLEHDARGERYARDADLKAALAVYRTFTESELKDQQAEANPGYALFHDGQCDALLREERVQKPSLLIACTAVKSGASAAIERVRAMGLDNEKRTTALRNASHLLAERGQYGLAAALLGEFFQDAAGKEKATTIASLRAYADAALDTPEAVARRTIRYYLAGREGPDVDMAIFSRNALRAKPDARQVASPVARKLMRSVEMAVKDQNIPKGFLLDLSAKALSIRITGDDSQGYAVEMDDGQKDSSHWSFFVVRESNQYRLLATDGFLAGLALDALDSCESGNLARARVLIKWARARYTASLPPDGIAGGYLTRTGFKVEDADAPQLRLAAASLLVSSPDSADAGVAIARGALGDAAASSDADDATRILAYGLANSGKFTEALNVFADLAQRHPDSPALLQYLLSLLSELHRQPEMQGVLDARLAQTPGNTELLALAAEVKADHGDYAGAYELLRDIETRAAKPTLSDVLRQMTEKSPPAGIRQNRLAWASLFTGVRSDVDLKDATEAARLAPDIPDVLHTLACAQALSGNLKEALASLALYVDIVDGMNEPAWLAYALIAEQYGEVDAARSAYGRVKPAVWGVDVTHAYDAYQLARLRLAGLPATH